MKWFLGALLLLLAALVLDSGLLAYATYVLLGLLVLSRLLSRSWVGGLEVTRGCDRTTARAGETVRVTVTVKNRRPLPVPWVLLEDLLPDRAVPENRTRLLPKKRRVKVASLAPFGTAELSYEVEFKARGYYQLGPLVLESGDLFGLHRRYRVGTAPHFVLVYPRVLPLPGYDLASRRPIGEVLLSHRLYEDPTRIAGVRHYEPGDPLNRVHWGATARTGRLHCKLYQPSVIAGATVLLDFRREGYPPNGEPYRSDLAVTAAATLAYAVCLAGQQVGLVTNGRDAADRIRAEGWAGDFRTRAAALRSAEPTKADDRRRPVIVETRRGPDQMDRILEALARVELNAGLTFAELAAETVSRMPRDATVVAILPAVADETALALGNLRRRGHAVTAVLVLLDEAELSVATGRLLAESIEVRHVRNEAALAALCQRQMSH